MITFSILTCIALTAVDGDTVKCDGVNLRPMGDGAPYVSGFDTPEVRQYADCPLENHLGILAMAKMSEYLQSDQLVIEDSGQLDAFKRPLVVLRLLDGTTVGQRLIDEGFARVWHPGYKSNWCE